MFTQKHIFLLLAFLLGSTPMVFAQPANDDCGNATVITDVSNWCSNVGQFTNVGATPSGYGAAGCFNTAANDVWFSFVPTATDVTITLRGATSGVTGGTLQSPEIALYFGSCGGVINELECQAASGGSNVAQAYQGGLFVGATYLIRVQGSAGATGTFQLCINNYNPPVEPTSDCPDAAILCDKSPFVVQTLEGGGLLSNEIEGTSCFGTGVSGVDLEFNSTWFVWTCAQAGTLEFALTPLKVDDDLDFVVYRLPNGIGDCSNKQIIRCMASGDQPGNFPSPCMGPTGLQAGSTDTDEDAGCNDSGDDAWLSPMDMVVGETYALVVNNYTSSGNGFNIEFGGTGLFLGPDAKFTTVPSAVCLGTPVQVVDASTFSIGNIKSYSWSFGADAMPQVTTGKGPHTVTFNESGQHPVVLTIETNLGCKVTAIQNVTIFPDVEVEPVIGVPECNGGMNGSITITNITKGTPPYQFSWNNGPLQSQNFVTGLGVGTYQLLIRDANNCETELQIPVDELQLTVNPLIVPPLCFGDDNGTVTLQVTNGTAPYQFDWGNGFAFGNVQDNLTSGVYNILGLDAKLCKGTFVVTVTDNPVLVMTIDTFDISCFGADDGSISVNPVGGVGNYTYLWSDGQTTQTATGLSQGQYSVTVFDGNECTVEGIAFVTEPADVGINLIDVVDLVCNGAPEGEIRVEGVGGYMPYMFSADGISFGLSDTLIGLLAGDYWVKIKDAAGCIDSVAATISQPPALQVIAEPGDTTMELGFTLQVETLTLPFGRPVAFLWSPPLGLDCVDCNEPVITAIGTQNYIVQITDSTGCIALDTVRIKVNKSRPIYPPNVFAPEEDYPNDHFTLYGGPAAELITLLRIYDRWGELVFDTQDIPLNDPNVGWDGTFRDKKVEGVFTFYANIRFIDQEEIIFEGSVTVVR